jgi:hypothetical protein
MRTYGLTYRGKDQGRWPGGIFCSCCYDHTQGYIVYGRNASFKRKLKRGIKRRARQQGKRDIQNQLKDYDEPENQP